MPLALFVFTRPVWPLTRVLEGNSGRVGDAAAHTARAHPSRVAPARVLEGFSGQVNEPLPAPAPLALQWRHATRG